MPMLYGYAEGTTLFNCVHSAHLSVPCIWCAISIPWKTWNVRLLFPEASGYSHLSVADPRQLDEHLSNTQVCMKIFGISTRNPIPTHLCNTQCKVFCAKIESFIFMLYSVLSLSENMEN